MIKIYTDGAAQGNPGRGGYGVIMKYNDHVRELSQGYRLTTNNRMELLAVISGLEAIRKTGIPVTIYSDSEYVVNAVEKGWLWNWERTNFKKKANADLWMALELGKNKLQKESKCRPVDALHPFAPPVEA